MIMTAIFILIGLSALFGFSFLISLIYVFEMFDEMEKLKSKADLYRELYDNASKYINKKLKHEKDIHNSSNGSDVFDELMCD